MPLERWNDDRLDDLHRTVQRMVPTMEDVAVLRTEMRSLLREIKELRDGLQTVVGNPVEERRQRRSAIIAGVIVAVVTALVTFALTYAAGGIH